MIMWNSVLRYLTQTYLTFAATTILALKSLNQDNMANYIVCVMTMAYLVIFPFFTFLFLCYNQGDMKKMVFMRSKSAVQP